MWYWILTIICGIIAIIVGDFILKFFFERKIHIVQYLSWTNDPIIKQKITENGKYEIGFANQDMAEARKGNLWDNGREWEYVKWKGQKVGTTDKGIFIRFPQWRPKICVFRKKVQCPFFNEMDAVRWDDSHTNSLVLFPGDEKKHKEFCEKCSKFKSQL